MKEEKQNQFEGLESHILLAAYSQLVVAGKYHLAWHRQKSLDLFTKYLNEDNVFECVRDRGVEDIAKEMAVNELYTGEEHLIIHACVAKDLLSIYFS